MPLAIDTHAHVFTHQCRLAAERRYTPDYEAPLADYLAMLGAQGAAAGVLVQPSFLGTDNRYLLECLDRAPGRLRGIVVVEPGIGVAELDDMTRRGVVGLRLNWVAAASGWRPGAADAVLVDKAAARGWQVEVQARGPVLAGTLAFLMPRVERIVIDHFGLPASADPADDPGYAALLDAAASGRVWVKLSAPYRFAGVDAKTVGRRLMASFGAGRLMWGSDWPWTQHEAAMNLTLAREGPLPATMTPADKDAVLDGTARQLFGFD
ncbi:MAG: amidohydrolase family protein [Rhodopseudomonas sp.]|nr:amidohydrolase family protein [Rhodopseudomonas sp.]